VDDEAWVERLRRAVAGGGQATSAVEVVERYGTVPDPVEPELETAPLLADAPAVASALRDLERRVAAVDIRLRQLNEEWDRLVDQVAEAVVSRLEQRERALSD